MPKKKNKSKQCYVIGGCPKNSKQSTRMTPDGYLLIDPTGEHKETTIEQGAEADTETDRSDYTYIRQIVDNPVSDAINTEYDEAAEVEVEVDQYSANTETDRSDYTYIRQIVDDPVSDAINTEYDEAAEVEVDQYSANTEADRSDYIYIRQIEDDPVNDSIYSEYDDGAKQTLPAGCLPIDPTGEYGDCKPNWETEIAPECNNSADDISDTGETAGINDADILEAAMKARKKPLSSHAKSYRVVKRKTTRKSASEKSSSTKETSFSAKGISSTKTNFAAAANIASDLLVRYHIVRIDDDPSVYDKEYRIYRSLSGEKGQRLLRNLIPEYAQEYVSNHTFLEIEQWLKSWNKIPEVEFFELDRQTNIVNFKNAAINIRSFLPVDKAGAWCYFQRYINADFPLDYTPNGENFIAFLDRCFEGDPDAEKLFQEVVGWVLSDIRDTKTAVLFHGVTDSGKSVAVNLLKKLTGKNFYSTLGFDQLGENFLTCNLQNKWLNAGSEMESNDGKDANVFKMLTGNDELLSDVKYRDAISFRNKAAMVFPCNDFPKFLKDEDAQSILNRIVIVPFSHRVPRNEWIENLEEKLFEEADFIVQWAMEGLRRYIYRGKAFSYVKSAEDAKEQLKISRFSVAGFIERNIIKAPENRVSTQELQKRFNSFSDYHGLRQETVYRWGDILGKYFAVKPVRGICYGGKKNLHGYLGIAFRNQKGETHNG